MDKTDRRNSLSEGFRFGLGFWISGAMLIGVAGGVWRLAATEPVPAIEKTTVIVENGPNGPTETVWVPALKPDACIQMAQLPSETKLFIDAYRDCRNGRWMTFGVIPDSQR